MTGLYTFTPAIFHACHLVQPSERGVNELADAVDHLIQSGRTIDAIRLDGWRAEVGFRRTETRPRPGSGKRKSLSLSDEPTAHGRARHGAARGSSARTPPNACSTRGTGSSSTNSSPTTTAGLKRRNIERYEAAGGNSFRFVEGSITDEATVKVLFDGMAFDIVFHEAALAGVRTSVENPMKPHTVNVTAMLSLLQAAADAGVGRFVNASLSVYGVPEYLPYDMAHPTTPQSPYVVTKLAGEHYCRVWHDLYGLPTVNLRYFTVYGPRMRSNMVITNFVSRCLNGEPPAIYGDGQQTRDFTYVDDIVEANLALLETDAADGETVNVVSTDTVTIEALAENVVAETGADVEVVYGRCTRGRRPPHARRRLESARPAWLRAVGRCPRGRLAVHRLAGRTGTGTSRWY